MSKNPPGIWVPPEIQRQIGAQQPQALAGGGATYGGSYPGGGYTGARIDRAQLSRWFARGGSPRADIIRDLTTLRARSRDQMRNAPVALGALNTEVNNVVGTGLSCRPAINGKLLGLTDEQVTAWQDDVAFRFDEWACSVFCDAARKLDFYGLQELAFRSFLESGDVFLLTPRMQRPDGATRLALQLIEADRCCNPQGKQDTDTVIEGVEIRRETTEAVAFHFATIHPGDPGVAATSNTWTRVPVLGERTGRRNVLHLMKPLRPDQVRGVPWIAPILEPLKQLQRWSDAELNAAVVSSLMSVFIKMDPDAFDDLFEEDAKEALVDRAMGWSGEMESGKAVNLLPGEDITAPAPGRPNPAFDPFWTAVVRQIGMALGMPFEVLVMHFQSSYSAARAALLMAWKGWRGRRDFLGKTMCQPGYELWLADEVAEGRIAAAGFFSDPVIRSAWSGAAWTGDALGSLDPVKEADAAEKRVSLGISTKDAESIAFDGVPWINKHRQRVREQDAERADGLASDPGAVQEAAQQAQQQQDQQQAQSQAQAELAESRTQIEALGTALTQTRRDLADVRERQAHMVDQVQSMLRLQEQGHADTRQSIAAVMQLVSQLVTRDTRIENHFAAPAAQTPAPPTVIVEAQAAPAPQVTVIQKGPDEQIHQRDADGNLVKTINVYRADKPTE